MEFTRYQQHMGGRCIPRFTSWVGQAPWNAKQRFRVTNLGNTSRVLKVSAADGSKCTFIFHTIKENKSGEVCKAWQVGCNFMLWVTSLIFMSLAHWNMSLSYIFMQKKWPESRWPVSTLNFLLRQQALMLPVHLINTFCQICFATGPVLTKRLNPWTPPRCYVSPCLASSSQSTLIKPVICAQVPPQPGAVRAARAWQTRFWGQCCRPWTCVYPDITNLSQSLYRHVPTHSCTHRELLENIKSMDSDKQPPVLL